MKKLFVLIVLLLSVNSYASGKLQFQLNNWFRREQITPMVGFSIYEPIFSKNIAYNSWTGFGESPYSEIDWYTSKHDVDFRVGKMTVSPGYQIFFTDPGMKFEHNVHMKVTFQLW